MVNNIYIGDYRNLTADVITNLYLYGTVGTPVNYFDRLRTKDEYAALRNNPDATFGKELVITLEMGTYMTVGAGRYAHASDASFVQKFFNNTPLPFALPDGEYTKQWLVDNYTVAFMAQGLGYTEATRKANAEFGISVKNYAIDANSADYSYRTYVFNNAGFTISSDAVFVVHNGIRYVNNMSVHAFSDNFDFVTGNGGWIDQLAQLGNQAILKNSIDPYNIGRTVAIEFTNKQNVPVDSEYNINDFVVDMALSDRIPKNGYLATTALPAMTSVVNYLKSEGTIEYTSPDDGVIMYGTNDSDLMLPGTSHSDIIVGGEGSDTITGGDGNDSFIFNSTSGIDTITDGDNGDKIFFENTLVTGTAKIIGANFYQKDEFFFLKEVNDLYVTAGDSSAVVIKNFFNQPNHPYDPNADYTFMGITIPKLMDADGDGIDDNIPNQIDPATEAAYDAFLHAVKLALHIDPLIIDLNGNGIALDSWQTSTALFDLNGDGIKENTGWTKAGGDDAFLVIDKNNDGKINDITEMFGNATTPGFSDLRNYDSNKDGVINASDSQFNLLRLWNDKNANGIVDAGEMTTLTQNNISSISLNGYHSGTNIAGNIQETISTITKTDGTTRGIYEIAFGFETPTVFTNPDATLPATFQLNVATLVLPYSRGYGSAYSWQAAMTLDPTLLAMMQDMMKVTPANFYQLNDKFQNFLFRWAGVENATVASVYGNTGVYGDPTAEVVDPRKVAFMEKITGKDFIYLSIHSLDPVKQAWDMFFNEFLDKFLVQGPLASAFPHASYDFATDTLKFNDTLDNVIAGIEAQAATMDNNSFTNYAFYAQNILQFNKGQFNDVNFDSKVNTMLAHVLGDGVNLSGFTFDGRLNFGSNEQDILYGSTKNDVLNGLNGNDQLYGYAGNDYFVGGKGNDILKGDAGNDIYSFLRGDGQDSIDDNAGVDKILLGDGITTPVLDPGSRAANDNAANDNITVVKTSIYAMT